MPASSKQDADQLIQSVEQGVSKEDYDELVRLIADEIWKRWQRQLRRERDSKGSRR